jgi:cytochrome oxidase Cu insertion factor (SCO1/SenC/PrrC family)
LKQVRRDNYLSKLYGVNAVDEYRSAGRAYQLLVLFFVCFIAFADAPGQQQAKTSQASQSAASGVSPRGPGPSNREIVIAGRTLHVPDVWVVTQDGKRVRFYSDLIQDKSVAVGFFYTRCTYVCTWHGQLFSDFQKQLGSRLGKDIFLISVTMDPETDTLARLKKWGARYGRKAGWTLVTGKPQQMNELLQALTGNKIGPQESHSSFFYIYNGKTGTWSYMAGSPDFADFEKQIEAPGSPGN